MSVPDFALVTLGAFKRMSAGEQLRLCRDALKVFSCIRSTVKNPSERWQVICKAKDLHRSGAREPAPLAGAARPSNRREDAAPAKLPVDAIFDNFPPYPLAGQACQCPTCMRT